MPTCQLARLVGIVTSICLVATVVQGAYLIALKGHLNHCHRLRYSVINGQDALKPASTSKSNRPTAAAPVNGHELCMLHVAALKTCQSKAEVQLTSHPLT